MPVSLAQWELAHGVNTASMLVPYEDIEYFVLNKLLREVVEEIENIDISTPRGRWIVFTILSAMNDVPKNATRAFAQLRGR